MGAEVTRNGARGLIGIRRWALWRTPPAALALIFAVELVAAAALSGALMAGSAGSADLTRFALLFALSAVYAEGADRIDRLRRYLAASAQTSNSVAGLWCFAAALVLPVGLAGCFAVLLYMHTLLRAARHQSALPFRLVYTGATEVLATVAAGGVVLALDPGRHLVADGRLASIGVVLALALYPLINQSLVSGVIYLVTRPARLRDVMLTADDETLEVATFILAIMVAESVVHAPVLAPLSLILVVVLRRSSLVLQLQQQALRDGKTGLLNAAAWRDAAQHELTRAARAGTALSVLMIDLDCFKGLNDRYGHVAGDDTLRAVAGCITDTLRGSDIVGRYGGEEFVALLPEVDRSAGVAAAERLCARIRELALNHGGTVSASVGVSAVEVPRGVTLDEVIVAADTAMYAAKRAGRDRVCATPQSVPQPSYAIPA